MKNQKSHMSSIHISVTPELKRMLEQIKTETHKSYSEIIIDLAEEEVARYEKEKEESKS